MSFFSFTSKPLFLPEGQNNSEFEMNSDSSQLTAGGKLAHFSFYLHTLTLG